MAIGGLPGNNHAREETMKRIPDNFRSLISVVLFVFCAAPVAAENARFRYLGDGPGTTRADMVFDASFQGSPANFGAGATLNLEHEWSLSFLSGLDVRCHPADVDLLDNGQDGIATESAASVNFQPYLFLGSSSLDRVSTRLLISSRHVYGNNYLNTYLPVSYMERTANGVRLGLDLKIRRSELADPVKSLYVGYQYLENSDVEVAVDRAGSEGETYGHSAYTALGVNALVGELADSQFGLDFWFKVRISGFVATMDLGYSGRRGLLFGLGLGFSLGSGSRLMTAAANHGDLREAD